MNYWLIGGGIVWLFSTVFVVAICRAAASDRPDPKYREKLRRNPPVRPNVNRTKRVVRVVRREPADFVDWSQVSG